MKFLRSDTILKREKNTVTIKHGMYIMCIHYRILNEQTSEKKKNKIWMRQVHERRSRREMRWHAPLMSIFNTFAIEWIYSYVINIIINNINDAMIGRFIEHINIVLNFK